jgi:hypothetical protein
VNAHELVAYLAGLDCCVALVRFDPQLGLVELLVPVLDRHARQAVNALLAGALLSAARLHTLLELMWFGVQVPELSREHLQVVEFLHECSPAFGWLCGCAS